MKVLRRILSQQDKDSRQKHMRLGRRADIRRSQFPPFAIYHTHFKTLGGHTVVSSSAPRILSGSAITSFGLVTILHWLQKYRLFNALVEFVMGKAEMYRGSPLPQSQLIASPQRKSPYPSRPPGRRADPRRFPVASDFAKIPCRADYPE